MKASELRPLRKPPRVFKLPPTCFTEAWSGRPTVPIAAGLRRISAGEQELAHKEAARKVDELFPELKAFHGDWVWKAGYDIALVHITLSYTLTRPDDVDTPLWPKMDGAEWVMRTSTSEGLSVLRNPTGTVVSRRFTVQGIGRLYDELNALAVLDNPLWVAMDDEQLASFTAFLPTQLAILDAPAHPGEREERAGARQNTSKEIRRMMSYVRSLAEEGMVTPPLPVEPVTKSGPAKA